MWIVLVSSPGIEWSTIQAGDGLSIKIINIPRSLEPWQDLHALFHLIFFFRRNRFDIVHSATAKAGLLTAIAALITGIPIRLHTFTGQPWVTLSGLMRWAARASDKLISVLNTKCYADSKSQAQFLISEGIISAKNISVIGSGSLAGVDIDRFNPDRFSSVEKQSLRRDLGINQSSRVIVFVGRISRDKGVAELIDAFHELLRMNYDVNLVMVGPHDSECGGISSLDLKDAGHCPRIHYIGYTESPEKYLAIADIFCLPSYREGFGTVVIEAAAMGLPTVGTAIYGLTDAVTDGETGILVPPRDESSLLKAIKSLLDDPDTLRAMGQAARVRCLEHFDAKIINEKVACEYWNVLKMKKKIHCL